MSDSPEASETSAGAPNGGNGGGRLPEHAVEVKGLNKIYRALGKGEAAHALVDVDLSIPRGSLFGLLGPNGAGKSTLINILAGLVNKTSGQATVWGCDIDENPRQARAAIGVVPQELNIDPFFTPRELLELQAGLYGVPPRERRTDEILAALGLGDKAHAYARTLSGGMRRRLMVAKAMVHNPPVLVLDEPTAGVDIELRLQLWAHVEELNNRGTTVLLTTHYLEEAEELCRNIAIIDHGEIIQNTKMKTLLGTLDVETFVLDTRQPLSQPPVIDGMELVLRDEFTLEASLPKNKSLNALFSSLDVSGIQVLSMRNKANRLEELFLRLVEKGSIT